MLRARFLLALLACAVAPFATTYGAAAESPAPSKIKELMLKAIEPTSNAVFYVTRDTPTTDAQWQKLHEQTKALIKAANELKKLHDKKDSRWFEDLKQLTDAAAKAEVAAKTKNLAALEELNDPLYMACANCHEHYLPKR